MSDFSVAEMVMPARHHYTVAFSDTVDISVANGFTDERLCRGLRCNAAGNIAVVDGKDAIQIYTVAAGEVLPFRAKRVNTTSTTVTAGSVVAWY